MDAKVTGPRIGITGSYGGLNLGDEAILEAIVRPLREELNAQVVVFSRDVKDTARRHGVEAVPVRTMTKDESREVIRSLDLLIFGGGGILYDADARTYLREVQIARERRVLVRKGYGLANQELQVPNAPEHRFHIASLSKSFTAAAILLLEQRF